MEGNGAKRKRELQDDECPSMEFYHLLGERKQPRLDLLAGVTMDQLRDEALQLIEQNQSFQGILSEGPEKESMGLGSVEGLSKNIVSGCLEMVRSQSRQASCPVDMLSAEVLSDKLVEAFKSPDQADGTTQLLSLWQQEMMHSTVKIIKTLINERSFNRVHFAKCLSSSGFSLPLEVLWLLHTDHILSFSTYLACCSQNPVLCRGIAAGLVELCSYTSESKKSKQAKILSVLVGSLITLAYPEKTRIPEIAKNTMEQVSLEILQTVIQGSPDTNKDSKPNELDHRLEILEVIRGIHEIPQSVVNKFFTAELHNLLYRNASELVMSQLVRSQQKWRFACLAEIKRARYQQFLYMFDAPAILEVIRQAFSKTKVNWEHLLSLTAVFVVCIPEASSLLEDCGSALLAEAIGSCDLHLLSAAFLITRQASLEGGHVFKPYPAWFQNQFADASASGLNNKRSVQFFFKFLTDLVPYEPAEYLKVHIIKAPQLPAKLRSFLTDYTALAKTRLMDLKEPIELLGGRQSDSSESGTDAQSEQSKQQRQATKEVERVIEQFDKTCKVPATVMEASIFRKPYFVGRFLPALLLPRKTPDVSDPRAQLITTLTKANKIPNSMLVAYHAACKKITEDHEVSSSEDDGQLSAMEKLTKCVDHFTSAVLQQYGQSSSKTGSVSAQLSLLAGHIRTVLSDTNTAALQPTTPVTIDVDAPCLDNKHVQLVDALLNAFCKTCAAVRRGNTAGQGRFQWASDFVIMLASISSMHVPLCYRLWDLLCSQNGPCLNDQHMYGLAAFLCNFNLHWALFTPVIVRYSQSAPQHSHQNAQFVDNLCGAIPFCRRRSQDSSIRFSCAYIQHAVEAFKAISTETSAPGYDGWSRFVPVTLIKKLWYFDHRLSSNPLSSTTTRQTLSDSTMKLLRAMTSSGAYKKLLTSVSKVSFEEWLSWEMMINSSDDVLSSIDTIDRRQYHQITVLGHYLPLVESEGGCGMDCRKACSVILNKTLDYTSGRTSSSCASRCPINGDSQGAVFSRNHGDVRADMVHLLQELTPILSRQLLSRNKSVSQDHWLIGQYHSRIDHVTRHACADVDIGRSVLITSETISFVGIALHLPAYLMFSDDPSSIPPSTAVSAVADFINSALRVHVADLCCLPFSLTLHLLKGILAFSATSEPSPQVSRILQQLVQECPLFFVSLQHYWERIKSTITSVYSRTEQLTSLRDVDSLNQCVTRLCSEEDILLSDVANQPAYIVGVSIFLVLSSSSRPIVAVERLRKVTSGKIATCVLACFIARFSEMVLQGLEIRENTDFLETSKMLLQCSPDSLLVFVTEKSHPFSEDLRNLRALLCRSHHEQLLPVVFFRIMFSLQEDALRKVSTHKDFPRITVRMRDGVSELRKACLDDDALRSCGEPFSIDFALQVSAFASKHVPQEARFGKL